MNKFYKVIVLTALACIFGIWLLISYESQEPKFEIVKDVLEVFQISRR